MKSKTRLPCTLPVRSRHRLSGAISDEARAKGGLKDLEFKDREGGSGNSLKP